MTIDTIETTDDGLSQTCNQRNLLSPIISRARQVPSPEPAATMRNEETVTQPSSKHDVPGRRLRKLATVLSSSSKPSTTTDDVRTRILPNSAQSAIGNYCIPSAGLGPQHDGESRDSNRHAKGKDPHKDPNYYERSYEQKSARGASLQTSEVCSSLELDSHIACPAMVSSEHDGANKTLHVQHDASHLYSYFR
jgi:hypothetical protein